MKLYITLYDYRPNYTDKRIRIHPIVQDLGKEPILQILCKILLMGNSEKMLWITTWLWVSNGFKVVIYQSIFSIIWLHFHIWTFLWNETIIFLSIAMPEDLFIQQCHHWLRMYPSSLHGFRVSSEEQGWWQGYY